MRKAELYRSHTTNDWQAHAPDSPAFTELKIRNKCTIIKPLRSLTVARCFSLDPGHNLLLRVSFLSINYKLQL